MREKGRLARFKGVHPEPERTVGLGDDHAAVIEGHTLFQKTVVGTFESPRFLKSAENSSKIGKRIEKGPWSGFPVFTLTLEERATCPRTCHMWQGCFGNAMPWAHRNDAHDPDFMPALKAEVITLVREKCSPILGKPHYVPPKGIVIRLHVLGDFFSVDYVRLWGRILRALPEIHVFGYTARNEIGDPASALIAAEIQRLNEEFPDRWVIRWSSEQPGHGRTIVVDEDPGLDDVVMCPAATGGTETCSTCALCWSRAALPKTIAFLRHGIKVRRRGFVEKDALGLYPAAAALHAAMLELAGDSGLVEASAKKLCDWAEISIGRWGETLANIKEARLVQIVRKGVRGRTAVYQVFSTPQVSFPKPPAAPLPARVPRPISARDPVPSNAAVPVHRRAPDEPLVSPRKNSVKAIYDSRTGKIRNPWAIGTADQFEIGTAEERIETLPDTEKERIARLYGATFKEKP